MGYNSFTRTLQKIGEKNTFLALENAIFLFSCFRGHFRGHLRAPCLALLVRTQELSSQGTIKDSVKRIFDYLNFFNFFSIVENWLISAAEG